jgi:hypothetical protein
VTPDGIYQIVAKAGKKAGVAVYPHRFRHLLGSLPEMSRIAFDASFGRLREHALPAAQRATLRPPGPPECRPATVTWGFMVCLDLMQR